MLGRHSATELYPSPDSFVNVFHIISLPPIFSPNLPLVIDFGDSRAFGRALYILALSDHFSGCIFLVHLCTATSESQMSGHEHKHVK